MPKTFMLRQFFVVQFECNFFHIDEWPPKS